MKESNSYHKNLKEIVWSKLYPMFRQSSINLLMDAMNQKEHGDLTGNTLTSFTCGIYNNGKLYDTINLLDVASLEHPTFRKLSSEDGVIDIERYDSGYIVTINTAKFIDTDKGFGFDTARHFLTRYTPSNINGISLVMTTGTEYSEYLEEVIYLNVLTETYIAVGNLLNGVFKG